MSNPGFEVIFQDFNTAFQGITNTALVGFAIKPPIQIHDQAAFQTSYNHLLGRHHDIHIATTILATHSTQDATFGNITSDIKAVNGNDRQKNTRLIDLLRATFKLTLDPLNEVGVTCTFQGTEESTARPAVD